MVKGDAARRDQARADSFTAKYKVGDIAYSPVYRHCKIIKMNKKTVECIQVDEKGTSIEFKTSVFKNNMIAKPILIEKYLFTV